MASINNLTKEQLNQLSVLKGQYDTAKTDAERNKANQAAIALRSSAGVTSDNYNKAQLDSYIKGQSNAPETGMVVKETYAGQPNNQTVNVSEPNAMNDPYAQQAELLNQLLEQQKQSTMAGLEASRQTSLSALGAEETAVKPAYAEKRSQARTTSQLNAKSFADFLAQRGLTNSGGAALGETNRTGALQGQIGGLMEAEQAQLGDINRRRTLAEQNYATGLQGADAQMNAQSIQNQLTLLQDQMARTEQDKINADNQLIQDKNAYLQTIGQFSNNYQAEIDRISDNVANGDNSEAWKLPYLASARQDKINQMGLDQSGNPIAIEPGVAQITSSTAALNLWKQLGTANESVANALGIPVGTPFTEAYTGGTGGSSVGSNATNQAQIIAGYEALKKEFITKAYNGSQMETTNVSPLEAINMISDNYNTYATKYTKEAVDKMISDLDAQTQTTSTSTQVTVTPKMTAALTYINENYDPSTTRYRSVIISYLDGLHAEGDITLEEGKYILEAKGLL